MLYRGAQKCNPSSRHAHANVLPIHTLLFSGYIYLSQVKVNAEKEVTVAEEEKQAEVHTVWLHKWLTRAETFLCVCNTEHSDRFGNCNIFTAYGFLHD